MAFIEKFLGKMVEVPEDRRYYPKQGLWAKSENQDIVFGLTQPFLVLAGGVKELDWLVETGQIIQEGEVVIFAITGKILYIDTPLTGKVNLNHEIKKNQAMVMHNPYNKGWLFRVTPEVKVEEALRLSVNAYDYIASLKGSEGFKNPNGLKGGVSGICKAVYSGIHEQKL